MNLHNSTPVTRVVVETLDLGINRGQQLNATLFRPEGATMAPLVIAASGGGWRRGHRSNLDQWGQYFAEHGIAFASIDYRRCNNGPCFPDNASDIAHCVQTLRQVGAQYGVDTSRIALLGTSAGAHLTALALFSDALQDTKLKAYVGIYGVYDLHRHWRTDLAKFQNRADNLTENMIGCGPFDNPDIYHSASPLRQIRSNRALPVFLSWGGLDDAIAPDQSADFARALQQAGFNVRTRIFAEAGHFWFSDNDLSQQTSFAAQLAPDLLKFLERHL
ncbi:MAG: prolyl oligopeptidase family serine peptidase [Cypionkella sp.]|nr:prolyl oligopeptidase family serine peptidase [Cypionkella sp.]